MSTPARRACSRRRRARPRSVAPGRGSLISTGQLHGHHLAARKSRSVPIAGYSRGLGQGLPRVAIKQPQAQRGLCLERRQPPPLGDIWLRTAPYGLGRTPKGTARVNDDNSLCPALPARSQRPQRRQHPRVVGRPWTQRAPIPPVPTTFADCRPPAPSNRPRYPRITKVLTDWAGTSSLITPNFGDYTDNATDGTNTYFTWSDGRPGIPGNPSPTIKLGHTSRCQASRSVSLSGGVGVIEAVLADAVGVGSPPCGRSLRGAAAPVVVGCGGSGVGVWRGVRRPGPGGSFDG